MFLVCLPNRSELNWVRLIQASIAVPEFSFKSLLQLQYVSISLIIIHLPYDRLNLRRSGWLLAVLILRFLCICFLRFDHGRHSPIPRVGGEWMRHNEQPLGTPCCCLSPQLQQPEPRQLQDSSICYLSADSPNRSVFAPPPLPASLPPHSSCQHNFCPHTHTQALVPYLLKELAKSLKEGLLSWFRVPMSQLIVQLCSEPLLEYHPLF